MNRKMFVMLICGALLLGVGCAADVSGAESDLRVGAGFHSVATPCSTTMFDGQCVNRSLALDLVGDASLVGWQPCVSGDALRSECIELTIQEPSDSGLSLRGMELTSETCSGGHALACFNGYSYTSRVDSEVAISVNRTAIEMDWVSRIFATRSSSLMRETLVDTLRASMSLSASHAEIEAVGDDGVVYRHGWDASASGSFCDTVHDADEYTRENLFEESGDQLIIGMLASMFDTATISLSPDPSKFVSAKLVPPNVLAFGAQLGLRASLDAAKAVCGEPQVQDRPVLQGLPIEPVAVPDPEDGELRVCIGGATLRCTDLTISSSGDGSVRAEDEDEYCPDDADECGEIVVTADDDGDSMIPDCESDEQLVLGCDNYAFVRGASSTGD